MAIVNLDQQHKIRREKLDVGRLFVDTKQIYLDAKANAAEFNELRLHVDVMYALVELLGRLIQEIQVLRADIVRGEVGLAGFDADLAGLQLRYRNLYRRFFEDLPPPEEWTAERWKSFEEHLEGPILMWNLKTCQERWGIPFGTPVCEGPDLQMALSLLHQTGVATEFQKGILTSLYQGVRKTLRFLSASLHGAGRAIGEGAAAALGAIAEGAASYFTPSKSTKSGFAWGLGVAAVIGVGGYLWLNNDQNKTKTKN